MNPNIVFLPLSAIIPMAIPSLHERVIPDIDLHHTSLPRSELACAKSMPRLDAAAARRGNPEREPAVLGLVGPHGLSLA
jgi:hypothetical protein